MDCPTPLHGEVDGLPHTHKAQTWPDPSAVTSRILFSELYKIMVNKVTFVGFMGGLSPPAPDPPLGGQVSVEWSRCKGSMTRRARYNHYSVAPFQRTSAGWMPNKDRKIVCCCRTQAFSHNSRGVFDDRINEAGVSTAAPSRSAVFCF